MQIFLPYGFAWLLHHRSLRIKSSLSSTSSNNRSVGMTAPCRSIEAQEQLANNADDLKFFALKIAAYELLVRIGMADALLNVAHRLCKRVLKFALLPVRLPGMLSRRRRRILAQQAALPPALAMGGEADPGNQPGGAAGGGGASRRARHVVVISRPSIMQADELHHASTAMAQHVLGTDTTSPAEETAAAEALSFEFQEPSPGLSHADANSSPEPERVQIAAAAAPCCTQTARDISPCKVACPLSVSGSPDLQPRPADAVCCAPGASPDCADFEMTVVPVASTASNPAMQTVVPRMLGLPLCVAERVLDLLDLDGMRVLRAVSRGLYFESSRQVRRLTVQQDNLETLISMPLHQVMPSLSTLIIRSGTPASEPATDASAGGRGTIQHLDLAHLMELFQHCMPHLKLLSCIDLSEVDIHTNPQLWRAFVRNLPAAHSGSCQSMRIIMREPTAWWATRGALAGGGMPGDGRDPRDHFPALLDALRHLQAQRPGTVTVDLQGITLRKHTAARLPQLCQLTCITNLTVFGKSAVAVPHGHRLSTQLNSTLSLKHLVSLELLSYEDVSDSELSVLSNCHALKHLYVDSLFIKMASGPEFPSIQSLTAARIKFVMRPLTSIFPNLTKLRLGALYSELNKKINSTSLSCLAGCSSALKELVVCPVLWKGQWQVLPTLPGLKRLSMVHCRDLSHLREVLKVVGRCPVLEVLELHSCSPLMPPWPGVVAATGAMQAADLPVPVAFLVNGMVGAPLHLNAVAAALMGAAAGVDDASGPDSDAAVPLSVGSNLFCGLAGCSTLRMLVLHECSNVLVRQLAGAELPGLRELRLRDFGNMLRSPDIQAAVVNLSGLKKLRLEASGNLSAAQAQEMPGLLGRPSLMVQWSSQCSSPSLYATRGFGPPLGA